jgi:LDH2 family malate/lactate/ureidoglycolate dehydrogenase
MRYAYSELKDFGIEVLTAAGLCEDEAELLMENMLYADSRGVSSHGISRLINYAKRVRCGVIAAGANAEVVGESASCLVIDGHNGVGAKIARQAMDMCIERARQSGCCAATVAHGNHFGVGAFYTKYAAKRALSRWWSATASGCCAHRRQPGHAGHQPAQS